MKRGLIFTVGVFLILIISVDLHAITVQFDTENRGPSDTLQVDAVTASGGYLNLLDSLGVQDAQVATVTEAGLGNSFLVPNYSIDSRFSFPGGDFTWSDAIIETLDLNLSTTGSINSVTFVPYFSVLGPGESVKLPFDVQILNHSPSTSIESFSFLGRTVDPSDPSPVTVNFFQGADPVTDIELRVETENLVNSVAIVNYLSNLDFPVITLQYGITLKSLDYTVPEPGTLLLLGSGLVGLIVFGRKKLKM